MCKYIIIGKGASGKDYCQNLFIQKGFKPLVQYTSRPKRPYETGKEYHFSSRKKIEKMRHELKFATLYEYNGWYYGFTLDDLKKCDVAIMSIANLNDLRTWYPDVIKCTSIIFLDIPAHVRKERLKTRYSGGNEDDTVKRRIEADENDFKDFNYFDIRFTTNEDAENFINKITNII